MKVLPIVLKWTWVGWLGRARREPHRRRLRFEPCAAHFLISYYLFALSADRWDLHIQGVGTYRPTATFMCCIAEITVKQTVCC